MTAQVTPAESGVEIKYRGDARGNDWKTVLEESSILSASTNFLTLFENARSSGSAHFHVRRNRPANGDLKETVKAPRTNESAEPELRAL